MRPLLGGAAADSMHAAAALAPNVVLGLLLLVLLVFQPTCRNAAVTLGQASVSVGRMLVSFFSLWQ